MTTTSTTDSYRELISEFADIAPERGFKSVDDLPGLCPEDVALIAQAKGAVLRQAVLEDVRAECERRTEAAHERQLADFYGGSAPQSERERLMSAYGLREGMFR